MPGHRSARSGPAGTSRRSGKKRCATLRLLGWPSAGVGADRLVLGAKTRTRTTAGHTILQAVAWRADACSRLKGGWPYSYWGQNVDTRVHPQDPQKVAAAIRPDYSLGSHVAALGVAFSAPAMGGRFAEGVFVGEHGSWNRQTPSGYKVVFVPFSNGRPSGPPVDFLDGFMGDDGKTRGRPVGVTVDGRGALIVADDLSNTIWRVTAAKQ